MVKMVQTDRACLCLMILPNLVQDLALLRAEPREGVLQPGVEEAIPGMVPAANAITRRGGMMQPKSKQPRKLVVDVREFMSSLPSVLHQQHMEVIPVTLEVWPVHCPASQSFVLLLPV